MHAQKRGSERTHSELPTEVPSPEEGRTVKTFTVLCDFPCVTINTDLPSNQQTRKIRAKEPILA